MIDPFTLAVSAGLIIFILSNAALLNALFAERNKLNQMWKELEYAFMYRADLIPLLIETFQEYSNIDPKSLKELLKKKDEAYKEHQAEKRILHENILDNYINQFIEHGESIKKLKKDIDFLELKNLFEKRRKSIAKIIKQYNQTSAQFDHHYSSIFSLLVRPIIRWDGPKKITEYHLI